MAWRQITTDDVLNSGFNVIEAAAINNIQGSTDNLGDILQDTVGAFIGSMSAAKYDVNTDGSVPDQCRRHVIAYARWEWLMSVPALRALKTKDRNDAYTAAAEYLNNIPQRKVGAIESPKPPGPRQGNWNSENRLIMRTHPIPPPARQVGRSPTEPEYANPKAVGDRGPLRPEVTASMEGNLVTLVCDVPTAIIYYTLDGSLPWANGAAGATALQYVAPFNLNPGQKLRYIAINPNCEQTD